ncbi:hypothetical protein BLNAU_19322 [Blattamonas nauphoetae]|uniref:Uncharacterized protein n=1 Tax=Blattamonas nauphoetae TaxID=2049346 RepID=A0ABQ9X1W8_9EUKA|nr:hypothetical protein BLNAU_19322 [Blattamonas nauphoetae]
MLREKSLVLGTGPLFSFEFSPNLDARSTHPTSCMFDTLLISSDLVNMSSLGNPSDEMAGRCANRQELIGCSVSHCTNHQHGTALMDPALCGDCHCLNSSFSSCVRSRNTILNQTGKAFTQGDQFFIKADTTGHFTRCTFSDMTVQGADHDGGAAILFYVVQQSLDVTLCAFHNCTATARDNDGGAVKYYATSSSPSFALSQSVFTHCAVTYPYIKTDGGSVVSYTNAVCHTTITDCAFENSFAAGFGGAVYTGFVHLTVANTLFRKCSCGFFGGALEMISTNDLQVSHCAFRACSSGLSYSEAKDVSYDSTMDGKIGPSNFEFCDSTSGAPNVYCESRGNSSSSWVPQVSRKTAIRQVRISSTENAMKMKITANDALLGSMSVLLDGANVARLVHVRFGQSSTANTTGEVEVATGSSSFLPSYVSFRVRSVGLVGWDFTPSIFSVEATLTDNLDYVIELFGTNLPHFSSLGLHFFDSNGNLNAYRTAQSLRMTLSTNSSHNHTFHFGKTYTIREIVTNGTVLASPHALSFTVPMPRAVLSSISTTDQNRCVSVQLFGEHLHSPSYTVTFSTVDDQHPPHRRTFTFSSVSPTALDSLSIPLSEEDDDCLRPDRTYAVSAAVPSDQQSIDVSVSPFKTPALSVSWAWLVAVIVVSSLDLRVLALPVTDLRVLALPATDLHVLAHLGCCTNCCKCNIYVLQIFPEPQSTHPKPVDQHNPGYVVEVHRPQNERPHMSTRDAQRHQGRREIYRPHGAFFE